MNGFNWDRFWTAPVVGILRGCSSAEIPSIVRAFLAGGLTTLEITMNTADADDQIRQARQLGGDALNIGAGTVTDLPRLERALAAGASFIVTPTLLPEVLAECRRRKVPVFPGAFTPTEIHTAWELGADLVKIFPAEALGPGYVRAIKAPLPAIRLLPTGGMDLESIIAYRAAGAEAVGVGSPLFDRARIRAGDWVWLESRCRLYRNAIQPAFEFNAPAR
jgi:2-dehydro-3-deoxyphosphogluconate aldolase/(4S)-4-hydroxy-2-oxoglutarate aldolase